MRSNLKLLSVICTSMVAGALLSFNLSAIANRATESLPVEELRTFADVFNAIQQGYVEPVSDRTLIDHAISGMLSGLDPHSAYLDKEAFKELQEGTQGEFGGLGIEVGMEDGFVKVVSPMENTPAFRAGIKAGDLIVKLDDTPVKGMTQTDAVKRMRGKPGTKITLTIMRKGEDRPIIVTITREIIKVQSVRSKLLEPGYGYIRIAQFQENTGPDVVAALNKLNEQGPLKGLILDLRNDPGGLLHAAIGVSAAFLPKDTLVVSTKGRAPDTQRKYLARPADYLRGPSSDYLRKLPEYARNINMAVLVNAGSASASEIVAGALQDHKRAQIIGTRTFGKGSVQTILSLSENTAIKLTTARYYTPNDRSIQATGIEPDVTVEDSPDGSWNHIREADLIGHLINNKDQQGMNGMAMGAMDGMEGMDGNVPAKKTVAPPNKIIELGSPDDYQLNQALRVMKGEKIEQPAKKADTKTAENSKSKDGKTEKDPIDAVSGRIRIERTPMH